MIDLCDVVPHALTFGYMERAFSGLLMRTNDANTRIRSSASELVLELASKFPEPPHSLLTMFIGKPDRVIHNHKDARARIDLVSSAVSFLCIHTTDNKAGLIPLDTLMDFVVTYLNHSHDEVRKAAVELVIDISEQVGFQSVSKYIDKDLRLSLAETVKKVAESNAPANDKKTTTKSKNNNSSFGGDGTVAELRALAAKATKVPASEKKSATATTKAGTVKRKAAAATTEKKTTTTRGTAATKKVRCCFDCLPAYVRCIHCLFRPPLPHPPVLLVVPQKQPSPLHPHNNNNNNKILQPMPKSKW